MRLAIILDLEPVLQMPQKLIGRREACVFGGRKQAFVAQAEQRQHRTAVPHPLLAAAVKPLQALHQEFDVANAAGRQLDVEAAAQAALGG